MRVPPKRFLAVQEQEHLSGFGGWFEGAGFRVQGAGCRVQGLQGYLAHKKQPPPGIYSSICLGSDGGPGGGGGFFCARYPCRVWGWGYRDGREERHDAHPDHLPEEGGGQRQLTPASLCIRNSLLWLASLYKKGPQA